MANARCRTNPVQRPPFAVDVGRPSSASLNVRTFRPGSLAAAAAVAVVAAALICPAGLKAELCDGCDLSAMSLSCFRAGVVGDCRFRLVVFGLFLAALVLSAELITCGTKTLGACAVPVALADSCSLSLASFFCL
ncbi:hypothetical protein BpHYR1_052626, partial [Brachionus plicatilis]